MICSDKITIVGFECSYKGRQPTSDAIGKILCWGACKDATDIRVFLGTAVQCRNHILNFVTVAAVRATGHKTPGESSVILQFAIMIQLTSRRILRD